MAARPSYLGQSSGDSHSYLSGLLFEPPAPTPSPAADPENYERGGGAGADPGFRRGGSYIQKGGGGSYRNFRSGSKLLQGPGQINKQKKIADSRRGGGFRSPKKNPCIRAWGGGPRGGALDRIRY